MAEAPPASPYSLVRSVVGPLILALAWTLNSHAPSTFAIFENTFLRALLFYAVVGLYLGRADLLRLAGVPNRLHAVLLGGILVLGAGLRFAEPSLPFHATNWMEDLVGRIAAEPEPDWYANGFGMFMRMFVPFTPDAGTLAPAALYAAARAILGDSTRALWAALLLAVLPLHLRLSASETMQIIPTLFILVGVVGFRGHARFRSRPLLVVGFSAFCFGVLTRPEWSVTALALPLAYSAPEDRAQLNDRWLWLGALFAAGIGIPLVGLGATQHSVPLSSLKYAASTFRDALFQAGPPHGTWAALSGAGFLFAFVTAGRGRWVTLLPVVLLAAMITIAGFDKNPANELQLLCAESPWILLGTACSMSALVQLAGRIRIQAAPAAAAGLAAVLGFQSFHATFFQVDWDKHEEFKFLKRVMPKINALEPWLPMIRQDREDFTDGELPSLPLYMLRPHTRDFSMTSLLSGRVTPPVIYYRGVGCYHQLMAGGPKLKHPQPMTIVPPCSQVEAKFRMTPVEVTSFDALPAWSKTVQHFDIGFYRLDAKEPAQEAPPENPGSPGGKPVDASAPGGAPPGR